MTTVNEPVADAADMPERTGLAGMLDKAAHRSCRPWV